MEKGIMTSNLLTTPIDTYELAEVTAMLRRMPRWKNHTLHAEKAKNNDSPEPVIVLRAPNQTPLGDIWSTPEGAWNIAVYTEYSPDDGDYGEESHQTECPNAADAMFLLLHELAEPA